MNLQELIANIQELCLSHKQISSFQVGNTFDVGVAKAQEYPCVWLELPLLVDYNETRSKTYSTALNFLSLCKADNLDSAVEKTSDMEVICDEVLQAIKSKFTKIGSENTVGVTMRSFSDDDLVGVRCDITFLVGRECDWRESFNTAV